MKKFCAVFALFHNEKYFLPIWIKYYGENFGYENLFVIDHNTIDGSTDNLPPEVNLIDKRSKYVHDNTSFMTPVLRKMQEELLQSYKYIINPDADEFLLPDPDKYENLREYVEKMQANKIKVATSTGCEVIHDRFHELPLDWNKPLLAQRKRWVFLDTYNKPIILGEPRSWSHGKHHLIDKRGKPQRLNIDPELILCHMHRIDYYTLKRQTAYKVKFEKRVRDIGEDPNHKIYGAFDRYFDEIYYHKRMGAKTIRLSEIESKWKKII